MSYLSKLWMAASVAVVQGHHTGDQGLRSLHLGRDRLGLAGLLPIAGFGLSRALGGGTGNEERQRQADDSLHKAMYFSCWGPS